MDGRMRVIYRPDPTRQFETVLRMKIAGDDDAEQVYIANIDAQSEKGYLVSRRDGDHWGLYEFDFRTETFGAPLFTHDKFDLDDYSFDRTGRLRWVSYIDDRRRVRWFQDDEMKFFADLETAVPDKLALVVSSSEDKNIKIVRTTAPTDPGSPKGKVDSELLIHHPQSGVAQASRGPGEGNPAQTRTLAPADPGNVRRGGKFRSGIRRGLAPESIVAGTAAVAGPSRGGVRMGVHRPGSYRIRIRPEGRTAASIGPSSSVRRIRIPREAKRARTS